jgi:hypothetical protein
METLKSFLILILVVSIAVAQNPGGGNLLSKISTSFLLEIFLLGFIVICNGRVDTSHVIALVSG